jgi:hypothetical protein
VRVVTEGNIATFDEKSSGNKSGGEEAESFAQAGELTSTVIVNFPREPPPPLSKAGVLENRGIYFTINILLVSTLTPDVNLQKYIPVETVLPYSLVPSHLRVYNPAF